MISLLIQGGWAPELIPEALTVSFCESRWISDAKNPRSLASGIFQFLRSTWATWGQRDVFDPLANVTAAFLLYQDSGWSHWVCKP